MDELEPKLNELVNAFRQDQQLMWLPIRHHSPACSHYLNRWLDENQPDQILIEGPIDFTTQLPSLMDPETLPPIALYGGNGLYPFGATSPEWNAIRWAGQNKKDVFFIDLPLADKTWTETEQDNSLISFKNESNLDHSQFIQNLVKQKGLRNSDELWSHWFESKPFEDSESFFISVFQYCAAARLTYSNEAIKISTDFAREQFMSQQIQQHYDSQKLTAVLTGGFHTLGLFDWRQVKSAQDSTERSSWIIRYSEDRLDAKSGYPAGILAPKFQHLLLDTKNANGSSRDLILLVLEIISQQANEESSFNSALKLEIACHLENLASLRGHKWPTIHDILDSTQSVLIKKEMTFNEPLIHTIYSTLSGNRLGKISQKQPPIPLVNELFQRVKKERFKTDNTTLTKTSIPFHDKTKVSRLALLYQCQFLGVPFANKIKGPDFIHDKNMHLLHEEWNYAWTPAVEATLVTLLQYGTSWDNLLTNRLKQFIDEMDEQTLLEGKAFLIKLVLMQYLHGASDIWIKLSGLIKNASDCSELTDFLKSLTQLQQFYPLAYETYSTEIDHAIDLAWEQLVFCLPNINNLELDSSLTVLIQVEALTEDSGKRSRTWRHAWFDRLKWLQKYGELTLPLDFACRYLCIHQSEQSAEQYGAFLDEIAELIQIKHEQAFDVIYSLVRLNPKIVTDTGKQSFLAHLNTLIESWNDANFIDSLPELRRLFSAFGPREVERLSEQVSLLNGWSAAPMLFNAHVDEAQLTHAQSVKKAVITDLENRGLGHWIKN